MFRGFTSRSHGLVAWVPLVLAASLFFLPSGTTRAAIFEVDSTADAVDSNPGDGTCATAGGECTLRAAIQEANAAFGTDTIAFDIPGVGPHTIHPATGGLPTVTDPVIIDGYTQPGASANTNGPGLGLNTVLKIEIDGTNIGAGTHGLRISGGSSTVRGLAINRVSCFGSCAPGNGILLEGHGNVIEGNFIGTDVTGTVDLGNGGHGVEILGTANNTIGGMLPAARNLISGNGAWNVLIWNEARGNQVLGNLIGTDATGTVAVDTGFSGGVYLGFSRNNVVGGMMPEARNVISGHDNSTGILIEGFNSTANVIQGNLIGTDVTGTAALGNKLGMWIFNGALNNTIGGTVAGAGNTIAYSDDDGIKIQAHGSGNAIQANSIFSNAGLGIDLDSDGVSPNDPGDPDPGANNLQNFPVLTSVTTGSSTDVAGTLDSTPNASFRLEFFSSSACDPSGHGEGETFIDATDVFTDFTGQVSFTVTLPVTVPVGHVVTATATARDRSTSEFGPCVPVAIPNQPPVAVCRDVVVAADADCEAGADVDDGSFDPDDDPITVSQDPPGPYGLGDTRVTLTVTDDHGTSDACLATVTVEDTTLPELEVTLTPDTLRIPNHHMVDIDASWSATDNCGTPTVVLTSVTSNEADDGEGDGHKVNDIQDAETGTADAWFQLRAERAGGGTGRIYTATYTATDASGNERIAGGFVVVPHDRAGMADPLGIVLEENASGTLVWWNEVPGAVSYDVIRGRLSHVADAEAIINLGPVVCIERDSTDESTFGWEDSDLPPSGEAFFYLVQYHDGTSSTYGTVSAAKSRAPGSGDCR